MNNRFMTLENIRKAKDYYQMWVDMDKQMSEYDDLRVHRIVALNCIQEYLSNISNDQKKGVKNDKSRRKQHGQKSVEYRTGGKSNRRRLDSGKKKSIGNNGEKESRKRSRHYMEETHS